MKYKNLNGTSPYKCKCVGGWLGHFRAFGIGTSTKCAVLGCGNPSEVGGHVQKVRSTDESWYIVPLCKACNTLTESFELKSIITSPAPANTKMTCNKP
jgi:hypothetical protein